MELNNERLVEFETDYFCDLRNGLTNYRYGQKLCNMFFLPKEAEDLLFYEESIEICRDIAWQFVQGTLEY